MTDKLKIQLAHPTDFDLLATLGRKAFQEAFGAYNPPDDLQAYLDLSFHPETIKKQLEDPNVIYLIANYENEAIGYAKLKKNNAPPELTGMACMQLERIYTLTVYLGKKVGKVLMEECIRIAENEKNEYLWLSVWQQNKRAIDFYVRWGFEIIGYKKFVIGKEINDDFVMALHLTEKP